MANFGDIETNINIGASQSVRRDSGNSVYEAFSAEDTANKSTNTVLGSSNTLYPTQNAVKVYVDTQSVASSANVIAQKAQPNGIATLDASGTIPTNQFPPIAISDTFVVATTGDLLNLTAQTGDIGVVTGNSTTYILRTEPASSFVNWVQILTPAAPVQSVNGEVGVVSLTTNNISDYTNKRYVTDADLTKLGNTSNVNSGDETQATIFAKISTATAATTGLLTNQDWTIFNNKETALTFSSGLVRSVNTITATTATGSAGGQNIYGGTGTTEGINIQANASDTTTGTIGLYGLQTKLFQNGVDADAYATQKSSGILNFESSQWNGSAEVKGNWTIRSIPSTINNTTLLTYLYGGVTKMSIDSGAALNMSGIVRSIFGNNVTTGPQAVHFIVQNTNTTVGDYTSIWNRNGGNMYTGSIAFKNTSHSATVGSADLEIWLANGGAAAKVLTMSSAGQLGINKSGIEPARPLVVKATSDVQNILQLQSNVDTAGWSTFAGSDGKFYVQRYASSAFETATFLLTTTELSITTKVVTPTIAGSMAASSSLFLKSTTDATKGFIAIDRISDVTPTGYSTQIASEKLNYRVHLWSGSAAVERYWNTWVDVSTVSSASTYTIGYNGGTQFKMANGGQLTLSNTDEASNSTTGAVMIAGGLAVAKKLYVGTSVLAATLYVDTILPNAAFTVTMGGVTSLFKFTGTAETSGVSTGAVVIDGGLGVAKRIWATNMTVTNAIVGSITGNAGTVTNGVYTTSDATALSATSAGNKDKYLHSNSSTGALEWSSVISECQAIAYSIVL